MLTNRFGGTKQTDKHRMELRYRKRRPNESLSDQHQDISRLMALTHPQLPSSSRDTIACDYYIDSLNDPDFALKVRERNPSSLDEALRIALQLEAWIRDTNRQKGDETGVKMKMRENRVATVETSNSSEFTSLKSHIAMLGKQLDGFMQQVTSQAPNFVQPTVMHQPPMDVSNSPVNPMILQQNSKFNTGLKPRVMF